MKIKAAIIGTGIGLKHYEAIEKYKGSEVKILCEKNKKKINQLKKKFPNKLVTSNENLIFLDKEINLVSIASYDNYHFQQIIKSINHNKNIIVEKPMCLNEKQLKTINNLLKNNNRIQMTSNLVLRVNSLFKDFKKRINHKKLYYIEGDYIWGRKNKLFGWRSKIKDYSLTLGAGIHLIDLIMWMTNLRPLSVYAMGNEKATKSTKFRKKSLIVMLFKFPNKLLVKITANGSAIYDHFHELKIFSSNQTLVNSRLGAFYYKKNKLIKNNLSYPDKKNRKVLIRNFIDVLMNKKNKPIVSIKDQIDLMSVCFAVDKSLKFNKTIKIKYL